MLGENIKKMRQSRAWSQEELGYRINTTRQTISKWEKGYSVPDASVLNDLAGIFECSVGELLGENIDAEENSESIANKLENLNIILARRNERWGNFWKNLGKIILIVFVVSVILVLLVIFLFSAVKFELS